MADAPRDHPEYGPLAGCAALTLMIALQLVLPPKALPQDGAVAAVRRPRLLAPATPADATAALRAPIFAPDRRPGDPLPGAAAASAAAGGGDVAVQGVIRSGRGFVAFLSVGGATRPVRPGGEIGGWRLAAATLDKVTLERGGVRRVVAVGAAAGSAATSPSSSAKAAAGSSDTDAAPET